MKAIFLPFGIKVKQHKDENKQQEEDKKRVKVSFNLGSSSLLLAELKKDVRDIFLQAQSDALGTTKLQLLHVS